MINAKEHFEFFKNLIGKNSSAYIDMDSYTRYANVAQNTLFDDLRGSRDNPKVNYGKSRKLDARLNPFRERASVTFTSKVANKPPNLAQITAVYTWLYEPIRPIDEDRVATIVKDPLSEQYYYAEDKTQLRLVKGVDTVATVEYLKFPTPIKLNYTIGTNGRAQYTAIGTVDFEWDANMEMELTNRMLSLMGLPLGDQLVLQVANNNKAQE